MRKITFKASTFHHVFQIFPSLRIKERSIFEVRSWILSYYKFLHMIEGAWPGHRVEETATARRHRALSGYNQNWINDKFLKLFQIANIRFESGGTCFVIYHKYHRPCKPHEPPKLFWNSGPPGRRDRNRPSTSSLVRLQSKLNER